MKNNHFLIRTMKKQKNCEEGEKTYRSGASHFFNNFANSLIKIEQATEKSEQETEQKTDYKPINLSYAKEKVNENSISTWLKHQHKEKNNALGLYTFVIDFFKENANSSSGSVEGEKLLEALVYLGIASDPIVIRRTLCLIYKCKNLVSLKINLKEFIELFKNNAKTDMILKRLNQACNKLRELKESKIRMGQEYKIEIDNSISIFKRKTTKGNNGFPNKAANRIRSAEGLTTISEHIELITNWWKILDNDNVNQVSINKIIELFISVDLAADKIESKALIFSQIGGKSVITFDEFQQIFAKSILKGALLNLSKRMTKENTSTKDMSSGYKLVCYRRALIMSGVKCPNSEISEEEGAKAISAIEKYNYQTNKYQK